MTDRKHCVDCELDYTDEDAHTLVHEAVAAASAAGPSSGASPTVQA